MTNQMSLPWGLTFTIPHEVVYGWESALSAVEPALVDIPRHAFAVARQAGVTKPQIVESTEISKYRVNALARGEEPTIEEAFALLFFLKALLRSLADAQRLERVDRGIIDDLQLEAVRDEPDGSESTLSLVPPPAEDESDEPKSGPYDPSADLDQLNALRARFNPSSEDQSDSDGWPD